MARIEWARASQFNWVFDNSGGVKLQEAVAGRYGGGLATVAADGKVRLSLPLPGAGRVYYIRGVWRQETVFGWEGFWAEPSEGDLTNYYLGGTFSNAAGVTIITLGTPLPPGTAVQVYYIYDTPARSERYEALNIYPCIRRAYRGRDDFTYDFAVDRFLDLMSCLHFAGELQGKDNTPAIRFLWQALMARENSCQPPLVLDTFERHLWEKGPFLMYRGTTSGAEFQVFRTEAEVGVRNRLLHVKAHLPGLWEGAWFGYGLGWSLLEPPFSTLSRVSFRVKGVAGSTRVHQVAKYGSGSATLVLLGNYQHQERRLFVIQIQNGGEIGTATYRWSKDGGRTWEEEGVVTGDRQHPVPLDGGLEVAWEGGSGTHFVTGDYWTFWGGEPAEHPRRLLVVLNDASPGTENPWGPEHTFVHALPDRFPELTAFDLPFHQFWRRDNLIDDGDRVRATWGTWHAASQPDQSLILLYDREETEEIFGDRYYTQRCLTWNLSESATAFGAWCGIDPGRCPSQGRSTLNFLLKPEISGLSSISIRVKVKDARGSYFYQDKVVQVGVWQRVSVSLGSLQLESGSLPLTHPLQAVDIGIPSQPPTNGIFLLTDLKFDEHLTFAGASYLRLLEFKIEQQGQELHEWWLDEVGLDLMATDPYPYVPRLAISLTPWGQNPWRGPTLTHYAHPLGPYLAGDTARLDTFLAFLKDAQDGYNNIYSGQKGPLFPVHTRNDLENVPLCGEENFNRFTWWPRFRDYRKKAVLYLFNGNCQDSSGSGAHGPTTGVSFTTGLCQPGNTSLVVPGTNIFFSHHPAMNFNQGEVTLTIVFKAPFLTSSAPTLIQKSSLGKGFLLKQTANNSPAGHFRLINGANLDIPVGNVFDNQWHILSFVMDLPKRVVYTYRDGSLVSTTSIPFPPDFDNPGLLRFGQWSGTTPGQVDYYSLERRLISGTEQAARWKIIRGLENGSSYPEAGYALGQYWAFLRLAEYYFVSGDSRAWDLLNPWLAWLDVAGAPDGSGWKFPLFFSEFGQAYGSGYDPGAAASLAVGCLYIYMRNGDSRAGTWARRILDDLRVNRQSPEYQYLYKSDYHYAWLNALVAHAFGLAVTGRPGQAHDFAETQNDRSHFQNMVQKFFVMSGDSKPNVLNSDLIPFAFVENTDIWDYAPHYIMQRQMGSMEGVVLMLHAAVDWGLFSGDWSWYETLKGFILADHRVGLAPHQISRLSLSRSAAGVRNVIRLRFADFDRNPASYAEEREEAAVRAWGEQVLDVDCRYGAPVIVEDPETARLIARRLLTRLSLPWEMVHLTTWLEGVRLEVGDTVALTSDFHGFQGEEFILFGKTVDLNRRRVELELARPAPARP